jgi:hypothetical protein
MRGTISEMKGKSSWSSIYGIYPTVSLNMDNIANCEITGRMEV